MPFTNDDKAIILNYRTRYRWGAMRICHEMPDKNWKMSAVNRLIRRSEERGTTARKTGSGRPRSSLTAARVQRVGALSCSQEDQPGTHLSEREVGFRMSTRTFRMAKSSVHRAKKQLGLRSFAKFKVHLLNERQKQNREQRCRDLLNGKLATDEAIASVLWTDEKIFTGEAAYNSRNDRVNSAGKKASISAARLLHERGAHKGFSVMVSAGVSANGKTKLHCLIEDGKNAKINGEYYRDHVLNECLLPDAAEIFGDDRWIFQQDSAPAHSARATQQMLEQRNEHFITVSEWPAASPDLNPMDYRIWAIMIPKVYGGHRRFHGQQELIARLHEVWDDLSQDTIRSCITSERDGVKARLTAIVEAQGGPIEHLLRK